MLFSSLSRCIYFSLLSPPPLPLAAGCQAAKQMAVPRKVVVAAIVYVASYCTLASPSKSLPSNALGSPTASTFVADSSTVSSAPGVPLPLSSPTSGQISFRTKTRNGVRGAARCVFQDSNYYRSIICDVCLCTPAATSAVAPSHDVVDWLHRAPLANCMTPIKCGWLLKACVHAGFPAVRMLVSNTSELESKLLCLLALGNFWITKS